MNQFSYTLALVSDDGESGVGDTLLNYRYQAMKEAPGKPAFSPRLSVVLPTGDSDKGLGNGSFGLQVNLPFSKQTGNWYWHWNAGLTWFCRVRSEFGVARAKRTSWNLEQTPWNLVEPCRTS